MTLVPAFRKLRQMDLCELDTSLIEIASVRLAGATYLVRPCLKSQNKCKTTASAVLKP